MSKTYTRLTEDERYQIYEGVTEKLSHCEIARCRVSIDERPPIVDEKIRIGDWEAETVIGKGHKGVLVTLADRVSKKTLIAHVVSKCRGGQGGYYKAVTGREIASPHDYV